MSKRAKVQTRRVSLPAERPKSVREQLAQLGSDRAALAAAHDVLERRQFALVLDARLAGLTWATIGEALGLSAQTLHSRYAPSSKRP